MVNVCLWNIALGYEVWFNQADLLWKQSIYAETVKEKLNYINVRKINADTVLQKKKLFKISMRVKNLKSESLLLEN